MQYHCQSLGAVLSTVVNTWNNEEHVVQVNKRVACSSSQCAAKIN